jgi:diguanylate cyclase (GGDEF)-like protein
LAEPPTQATRLRPLRLRHSNGAVLALRLEITTDVASLLLIGPRVDGGEYDDPDIQLLAHVAADLELVLRKAEDLDRLRAQAFLDSLTGSYNRRGFDEHLHVELTRAKRYDRPFALMLVDLDAFKRINDKLGHQSGDYVIRRFAELLTNTFRTTDIISRYGGDEFAVIFPETTGEEAVRLAGRIRVLLRGLFPDSQISRAVTASFGVAAFPADAALAEDLVASADRALYAAKTAGRDRVVAAKRPRRESR